MTYSYALYLLGGKNMGNFILRKIRHVNALITLTSLGTLEIKETETDRMIFSTTLLDSLGRVVDILYKRQIPAPDGKEILI